MMVKELLLDIAHGYKKMFMGIGIALFACAFLWGIISAILTIAGKMDFKWWYVPCWVLTLSGIAGCFGQNR